jgi:hypothetical protein
MATTSRNHLGREKPLEEEQQQCSDPRPREPLEMVWLHQRSTRLTEDESRETPHSESRLPY